METDYRSTIPRWGYAYVILAAVLWGISGSSSKFLFNSGVTPFQLVQIRITFSTLILFGYMVFRRPELLKINRRDVVYFALLGALGMAAVQFTYLYAISKINVAAAILLQYMAPSLIAVYSVLFAGDKLNRFTITAVLGAMFGCYLVVGAYSLDILSMNKAGIIGGLLSALAFATYSLQGEYGMRRYHPLTVLFYALLFGSVSLNALFMSFDAFTRGYSLVEWGWILYIVLLGTIVPFGCYFKGISLIRSTRACITATLEPITAALAAYLFLGEIMEPLQLFGGVLVIGSIILLQLRQEQDENTPELLRAKHLSRESSTESGL